MDLEQLKNFIKYELNEFAVYDDYTLLLDGEFTEEQLIKLARKILELAKAKE